MSNILSHARILIVEDQADVRLILKNMLLEIGVTQIFEASDGKEADSFVKEANELINLVICDWNMPNMTGDELYRRMKKNYPHIPFLMLTGRVDMGSILEAKKIGITGYIAKPFSPQQLEKKISLVLKKSLLKN